jgi:hypothetical protein
LLVLNPISSTIPSTSPIFIQSPTFIVLSTRTVSPPKRLAAVSFAARAKARPPIPKEAITALMFIPHS